MTVMVPIPSDLAARFGSEAELGRRVIEALALEEFRASRMTKPELRRLLGFETRFELDGFLKAHGVYDEFTLEEIQEQVRAMERLGF